MRGLILAAGRGRRLGKRTEVLPKCLTELAGRTLLQWQTEAFAQSGIRELAIVRGYLADRVQAPGARYFDNPRWDQTNMVRSLLCAADWLEGQDFILSYSDIVYPAETLRKLSRAQPEFLVIGNNTKWLEIWSKRFADPLSDAESFLTDPSGRLIEIGQRPVPIERIQGQYMGLLRFTPAGWHELVAYVRTLPDDKIDRLDMTSLLGHLLVRGLRIDTVAIENHWYEVDTETDLQVCEQEIATGRSWLLP